MTTPFDVKAALPRTAVELLVRACLPFA